GNPEGGKEPVEDLGGGQSLMSIVAVEVHVELDVGEARYQLVGQMQGQGSLAHPSGPRDSRDHHRLSSALDEKAAQMVELGLPAGEVSDVRGELVEGRQRLRWLFSALLLPQGLQPVELLGDFSQDPALRALSEGVPASSNVQDLRGSVPPVLESEVTVVGIQAEEDAGRLAHPG